MNVITPKTASGYETHIKATKKADNILKKLMTETEREIIAAVDDTVNMNIDAISLYTLFKSYGFTVEQLKAFYNEVNATLKAETEADACCVGYGIIPQRTALKDEAGIDLEAWRKEVESNG